MFRVSRLLLGLICACIVLSSLLFVALPFVGDVGIWALGGDFAVRAFSLLAPVGLILLLVGFVRSEKFANASLSFEPLRKHIRVIIALAVFLTIALLATLFAWNSSVAFWGGYEAQQGFIAYVGYAVLMLAAIFVINAPRRLLIVSRCLAYTAAIVAGFALLEVAGFRVFPLGFPDWAFARGVSTMTNPNYLGSYLVVPCLVALGLVLGDRGWPRILAGLSALLISASLLFTLSRGAWAGLALGLLCLTAFLVFQQIQAKKAGQELGDQVDNSNSDIADLAEDMPATTTSETAMSRSPLHLLGTFWAVLIALVLTVAFVPVTEFETRVASLPTSIEYVDTGMGSRFLIWEDIIKVIAQNPVLGVGPDNLFFAWQGVTGPEMLAEIGVHTDVGTAHNYYLDITAATGIVGGLAFLVLIVLVLATGFRTIRTRDTARSAVALKDDEQKGNSSLSSGAGLYVYSAWVFALCGMLLALSVAGIRTPLLVCFYLALGVVVAGGIAEKRSGHFSQFVSRFEDKVTAEASVLTQLLLRTACIALGTALTVYATLMLASAAAGNLNTFDPELQLARTERALAIAPWRTEPLDDKLQSLEWLAANHPETDWDQCALSFAFELTDRFPHNASYWHLLSVLRISDTASSLAFAEHSLELRPTYLPAQLLKGLALVELGSPEEGIAIIESAVEINETINPNWRSSEYLETLIFVQLEQGNQDEAVRLAQELGQKYPDSPLLPFIIDMLAE